MELGESKFRGAVDRNKQMELTRVDKFGTAVCKGLKNIEYIFWAKTT
jgi:hypothetical protein